MAWYDIFKLNTYVYTQDPLSKKTDKKDVPSAGVSSPDSVLDLRNLETLNTGGAFIRVQNELVDMTTATNRLNRYKEYDRLVLSIPEIEMVMTVLADEACVCGDTIIETLFHGPKSISWLAENLADERFPVYCYDFEKEDYTLGWAFAPRYVKTSPTVRIILDNGQTEIVTADHRILKKDGTWTEAGNLKFGDELMPFYRIKANQNLSKIKNNQFPRVFTHNKGWVNERQFIDEWRLGKDQSEYEISNQIGRMISNGLNLAQISKATGHFKDVIMKWLRKTGFSYKELRYLSKNPDKRRVLDVQPWHEMAVYDLSVDGHENFATSSLIMHNCQKDEDGKCFKIVCKNKSIVEELEDLFFHRGSLYFNQQNVWDKAKRLFIKGDLFLELVLDPDNPKLGICLVKDLPAETMFRIETVKGKILEFQQSKEAPDYEAIKRAPVETATESELQQSTAIRFAPEQIVHMRLGDYRRTFYPYGVSLIEPARGAAHQLRMMEDAMVIYRLSRAPERRVFYIDIGSLPGYKAEALVDRIKDQFRKKKVPRQQFAQGGATAVEERWHPPAQDEDFWIPTRAGSATRIDTLPGAQNLGEIDDAVYFRNKLFMSLNFPKSYFSLEDPNATRITLSAQDCKFARMIERLQSHMEEGFYQIADRHLQLRGFPPESYDDLSIKMTPPSDWRELSRQEVWSNRIDKAISLKGAGIMSDFDIFTRILRFTENEAKEMIARNKVQKLEDLKLQIIAANPNLSGIGTPNQGEQEVGAAPGGPSPDLGPPGVNTNEPQPPPGGPPTGSPPLPPPPQSNAEDLAEPSHDDIIKYDLEIEDYESEQDHEDIDYSEIE